jgi:hypothetical protein
MPRSGTQPAKSSSLPTLLQKIEANADCRQKPIFQAL